MGVILAKRFFHFFVLASLLSCRLFSRLPGLRVGWRYEVISHVALLGVPTPASSTALAPESCCIGCIVYLALRGCVYCMALQGIHTYGRQRSCPDAIYCSHMLVWAVQAHKGVESDIYNICYYLVTT